MDESADVPDGNSPPVKKMKNDNHVLDPEVVSELSNVTEVNLVKLIQSRRREIEALSVATKHRTSNTLLMQTLPSHMRRRAMSHDTKRLPRRLRNRAEKEMNKSKPKKTKCPSRYHRRRPSNLLQDYERRKKEKTWLETHIWHAKRFHMKEIWGYKIPDFPNDKSIRAAYRASANHAILMDMSYYCCIEVKGKQSDICAGFAKITNANCGPTLASKMTINGTVEGHITLFMIGKYPYGAIATVSYTWMPQLATNNDNFRTLWIWSHPSTYFTIFQLLLSVFEIDIDEDQLKNDCKMTSDEPFFKRESAKIYGEEKKVQICSLKDSLVRFRLIGPESHAILADLIKPIEKLESSDGTWLNDAAEQDSVLKTQAEYWQNVSSGCSADTFPPNSIIGLLVKDPRLLMPKKRTKIQSSVTGPSNEISDNFVTSSVPVELASSLIWSGKACDQIRSVKKTDLEINKLRAQHCVPGSEVVLPDECSNVPILLLQQPGNIASPGRTGYASGWDIIIPSGWSMAFWLPLVFRGARVGGLRELKSISEDAAHFIFPSFHPDTLVYCNLQEDQYKSLKAKYERIPPAKRFNYAKQGITHPFYSPWNLLVNQTDNIPLNLNDIKYNVLREVKILNYLSNFPKCDAKKYVKDFSESLIPVVLTLKSKGVLTENSVVCIPSTDDMAGLKSMKAFRGPVHSSAETSRTIMGYVSSGRFMFSRGQCCAVGFVSYKLLCEFQDMFPENNVVLARYINTDQFRFADLKILKRM